MLFYITVGAPQAVPGTACVEANRTACKKVPCSSVVALKLAGQGSGSPKTGRPAEREYSGEGTKQRGGGGIRSTGWIETRAESDPSKGKQEAHRHCTSDLPDAHVRQQGEGGRPSISQYSTVLAAFRAVEECGVWISTVCSRGEYSYPTHAFVLDASAYAAVHRPCTSVLFAFW
jgi:hypothetical protein